MPAVWPEKLESDWNVPTQPDAKRPRRSSLDSGLSLTSTFSVETTWTASDIAKAGCLLTIPPKPASFDDEEEMRRVYSLIYDVFRYKTVLNQALQDVAFFIEYPQFQKQPNLVWLLFYDLYKRRFLPRDHHDEQLRLQLFEQTGLLETDLLLWSVRVRLAASVARLRIKNNALKLSQLLPPHLRDERVIALDETPVTGWINTFTIEVEEVKHLIEKAGLISEDENGKLDVYNYEFDTFCPKFLKCHPSQRSDLAQSTLVRRHHIVLQDRAFCLGPSVMSNLLLQLELSGNVVLTHINSPRTMAYLANILVDNEKIDTLIAFGAAERKEEYVSYLQELGVTNTEVHAERFVDISSESEILENVVGVLATPPNTYSGVIDPVDLVCSRGGDLSMLDMLTATEIGGGSIERVNKIMEEQRQTLRISMSRPQIQIVLYETHSIVPAENSEMVTHLVWEMNNNAKEKHAEEQGRPIPVKTETSGGEGGVSPANIISVEIMERDKEPDRSNLDGDNIIVPPCDLFELTPLPVRAEENSKDMEKEGCYLAYLRRKEIVRLNAKYMINIAESRGLFGGDVVSKDGKKSAGARQHRKKPELQRSESGSPPLPRPKSRRFKFEVDRIAAPTQASILRRTTEPGKRLPRGEHDSTLLLQTVISCPRHQTHLQQDGSSFLGVSPKVVAQIKRQDARRWWGETARHIIMFGFNVGVKQETSDEDDKPVLKLTRSQPNGRVPFPISVTSLEFSTPPVTPQLECSTVSSRMQNVIDKSPGQISSNQMEASCISRSSSQGIDDGNMHKRKKPSLKKQEAIIESLCLPIGTSRNSQVRHKKCYEKTSSVIKPSKLIQNSYSKCEKSQSNVNLSIIDIPNGGFYNTRTSISSNVKQNMPPTEVSTRTIKSLPKGELETVRESDTNVPVQVNIKTESIEKKLIEVGGLERQKAMQGIINEQNERIIKATELNSENSNVSFMEKVKENFQTYVNRTVTSGKEQNYTKNLNEDNLKIQTCTETATKQILRSRSKEDKYTEIHMKTEYKYNEIHMKTLWRTKPSSAIEVKDICSETLLDSNYKSQEANASEERCMEIANEIYCSHKNKDNILNKFKSNSCDTEGKTPDNQRFDRTSVLKTGQCTKNNEISDIIKLKLSTPGSTVNCSEEKSTDSKYINQHFNIPTEENESSQSCLQGKEDIVVDDESRLSPELIITKQEVLENRLSTIRALVLKLDEIHDHLHVRHKIAQERLIKIRTAKAKPKLNNDIENSQNFQKLNTVDHSKITAHDKTIKIPFTLKGKRIIYEVKVKGTKLAEKYQQDEIDSRISKINKYIESHSPLSDIQFVKRDSEDTTIKTLMDQLTKEQEKGSHRECVEKLELQLKSEQHIPSIGSICTKSSFYKNGVINNVVGVLNTFQDKIPLLKKPLKTKLTNTYLSQESPLGSCKIIKKKRTVKRNSYKSRELKLDTEARSEKSHDPTKSLIKTESGKYFKVSSINETDTFQNDLNEMSGDCKEKHPVKGSDEKNNMMHRINYKKDLKGSAATPQKVSYNNELNVSKMKKSSSKFSTRKTSNLLPSIKW